MYMKKIVSAISALAIAASTFAAMTITANAEDSITVSVNPVIDTAYIKGDATDYSAAEEVKVGKWYVGGGSYGSFALMKFDVSEALTTYSADYTLSAAALTVTGKYEGSYTNLNCGLANKIADDWDATLTMDDVKALYGNGNPSAYSNKGFAADYKEESYDVKEAFSTDTDGVLTFGFWCNNDGRKAYIKMSESDAKPALTLTFVPKVSVTANVVAKCGETTLSTDTVSGYVGEDYSYAPYAYIESEGSYYKYDNLNADNGSVSAVTGTLAENMADIELTYIKVDDVVYYAEVNSNNYIGHSAFSKPADRDNASGGKDGGAAYGADGKVYGCYERFNAPVSGTYKITVNAVGTTSKTRKCYLAVDATDVESAATSLSCDNGSYAQTSFEVFLTAGEHQLNYLTNGGAGFFMDYMVVELVEEEVTADTTYTFEGVLSELLDKTFKATATYNGKTATAEKPVSELIDKTDISDTSNVKFGIVITGVPETAVISNIVIE